MQATPGGAISQEFSFVSAPVTSAATSVNVSPCFGLPALTSTHDPVDVKAMSDIGP